MYLKNTFLRILSRSHFNAIVYLKFSSYHFFLSSRLVFEILFVISEIHVGVNESAHKFDCVLLHKHDKRGNNYFLFGLLLSSNQNQRAGGV